MSNNDEDSEAIEENNPTQKPSTGVVSKSTVLRERHKMQTTKKLVETMRNALPVYTLEQIREFRLPYHEALTINLQEKGFVSTASYINELIIFQDEMRKDAPPGSSIAMRPQLKYSREEIVHLADRLKMAEIYHNENNIENECEEFLKLGIHFAFISSDWWWLGEQILIQGIKVSSEYTALEGKYEALTRYAYARFLLENVKEFEKAAAQLQITSVLCDRKGWTSVSYFPEVRGTLYMQTNRELADCMIRDVQSTMRTDPKKAIRMSVKARHIAGQGCHFNGECKALVLKGLSEMAILDTKTAVNSLLNAFIIQQKFGSVEGLCEVRIHLAKAYLLDNCANASLKVLMDLKSDAEEFDLPFFLGQAYKHLGDYYLSCASPSMANPVLKEALRIFKECNVDSEEIANVRNLEAISAGLQLFPTYIEILNDSGTEDRYSFNNLMKIVDWKDQRTEFWENTHDLRKAESLTDVVKKSLMKVHESRAEFLDEKFESLFALMMLKRSELEVEKEKDKDYLDLEQQDAQELDDEQSDKIRTHKVKLKEDEFKSKREKMVELFAHPDNMQSHATILDDED